MAFLPELPPTGMGASPELVAWLDRQNQQISREFEMLRETILVLSNRRLTTDVPPLAALTAAEQAVLQGFING